MKVLQALQNMNDDMLPTTRMFQPINSSALLDRLSKTVEMLQAKIENPTIPKSSLDALEVWATFKRNGFNFGTLEPREKRSLCIDPRTAVRPQMVQAVTENLDVLIRASTLYGFAGCYFMKWREIAEREPLEKLLKTVVRDQNKARRSRILTAWAERPGLFSPDADKQIANEATDQRVSVSAICSAWFIAVPSQLAQSASEAALNLAVSALIDKPKTYSERAVIADLRWIADNLLLPSIDTECYRQEMGRLILSNLADRYSEAATAITALVCNDEQMGDARLGGPRLGDPRLPLAQANWRNMPAGAQERVFSWLAKETIEFFFNAIVPPSDENRRRAEFWLRFAMKPGNIRDFQIALSSDDARLLRRRSLERVAYPEMEGAKTSAFMMQFEGYYGLDYVVVEFSETGHAAYIYDRRKLPSSRLSFRSQTFTLGQLKRQDVMYDRVIHNGDWETKLEHLLSRLGIRP